jgi:hypothetical protein
MTGDKPCPSPLPRGTINAHIRHGDKSKEMKLVPAEKYFEASLRLVSVMPNSLSRVLFVTSDSDLAIQECQILAERSNWSFIFSKIPRMSSGFRLGEWGTFPNRGYAVYTHLLQLLWLLSRTHGLEQEQVTGTG